MKGTGGGRFGSPPPALSDSEVNRRVQDSSRFPHYVKDDYEISCAHKYFLGLNSLTIPC